MKKIILFFFLISMSGNFLFAQSASFKVFAEQIKSSDNYYWGKTSSSNMREAEQEALSELLSQIAVNVSSSYEQNIVGKNDKFQESVTRVLKTYTTASLKNVKFRKDFFNGKSYVFAYIDKKTVSLIFEERKKLCYSLYQQAVGFEGNGDFSDALKYYYYSLILMNSIPEQNIEYFSTNLKSVVPAGINRIIKGVHFGNFHIKKNRKNEKIVSFDVSVNNKKADNLQFSFWDGNNFIDAYARDGVADIDLIGSSVKFTRLAIKIKYEFFNNRKEIKEVSELWDLVNRPEFNNSITLSLVDDSAPERTKKSEIEKIVAKDENSNNSELIKKINSGKFKISLVNKSKCKIVDKISKNAIILLELIDRNDTSGLAQLFSKDKFMKEKTINLIKYNKINFITDDIKADLNKTVNGFEIRKVEVLNNYRSLNKQSKEYLVIDFDKKGNLYDINFGIMDNLYNEFVTQAKYGHDWGNRQIIIKFMEKYRTAYLTRNLKILNEIFANDALIIVGRVINKKKLNDAVSYIQLNDSQPKFEQIKYTKQQYLKKQKRIFESREDIFLDYSKFNIMRKNASEGVYGISLRQSYESTGYSDEGFLFLLIDFKKKNPQIYVRSWQPQEWDSTALIGLSNFRLNH